MTALEFLARVQRHYESQDYDLALREIAAAESEGKVTVELLLLKAACIQLSSNSGYPLHAALDIYESILEGRPKDPRALTEAGFFLLNVQNNAGAAQAYFERASGIYWDLLYEVMINLGRAKCEGGSSTDAVVSEMRTALTRLNDSVVQRLQAIE